MHCRLTQPSLAVWKALVATKSLGICDATTVSPSQLASGLPLHGTACSWLCVKHGARGFLTQNRTAGFIRGPRTVFQSVWATPTGLQVGTPRPEHLPPLALVPHCAHTAPRKPPPGPLPIWLQRLLRQLSRGVACRGRRGARCHLGLRGSLCGHSGGGHDRRTGAGCLREAREASFCGSCRATGQ